MFRSGRQFAAWLGLTPRAHSSGGKERLGGISKQGDGYLRKLLVVGENMMLSASSKAKVVYYDLDDEGKVVDKCVKDYTDPSTYIIDATCTPVAAWAGSPGMSPALIIGAGVVGAALINTDDKVDVGPLSSSVRHL